MTVTPGKYLILWEHPAVMDDLFTLLSLFLIYIVAYEEIEFLTAHYDLFEFSENLCICGLFNPVIRIDDLEEKSRCILDTCIDCTAMSLIWLVYRTYYFRIFLLILSCYLQSIVLGGTVIDDQYLNIISAGKQ